MADDEVRLTVRLPRSVRDAAAGLARSQERSLNWVVVDVLRKALASAPVVLRPPAPAPKVVPVVVAPPRHGGQAHARSKKKKGRR